MAWVNRPSLHLSVEAVNSPDESKVSRGDEILSDQNLISQMKNELQELKVQNKKLQLSYDDLLFLATSAPSGDELEVPDDLNFLSNSSHDEVRELENYSRCSPLENEELSRYKEGSSEYIADLRATIARLQHSLTLTQQEVEQLRAQQAKANRVATTTTGTSPSKPALRPASTLDTSPFQLELQKSSPSKAFSSSLNKELQQLRADQAKARMVEMTTTGTSPSRPAFGRTIMRKWSPFQQELQTGTPSKEFSCWLSSIAEAQGWGELSSYKRAVATAAKQSLPQHDASCTPSARLIPPQPDVFAPPPASKIKDMGTDEVCLSPETMAMMERLTVLDPLTLPPPSPSAPIFKSLKDVSTLSPKTEAMLDFLLSPSNLPPTPTSSMVSAVVTSTALKPASEVQALQGTSVLLTPVAGTAGRTVSGSKLVRFSPQAAAAQEAVSPETKALVHWLFHPEAYPTPTQGQVDALFLGVPITTAQLPTPLPCLTPVVNARSQGRAKASVAMASGGARRTPLGDLTNLHGSEGTSRTSGTPRAAPSFAPSSVQRQLTPLFLGVPVTNPQTPALSPCLSPTVKAHSQGRAKASVGVASAGARRTPLGDLTNLQGSQGTSNGTPRAAPTFTPSSVQRQLTPLFLGVPVTNPQTPALSPCLTPTVKTHSQGRSKASVGVASAGAHLTSLGDVTNSQVMSRTRGSITGSPTFAPSPLQRQSTPVFNRSTPVNPSRLGGLKAYQAPTMTPAAESLNVKRAGSGTLASPLQLQSSLATPCVSSLSCGGTDATTAMATKNSTPDTPLAFEFVAIPSVKDSVRQSPAVLASPVYAHTNTPGCAAPTDSPKAACATRRASLSTCPSNRPPWSIAAPNSPAVSAAASAAGSAVVSPAVRASAGKAGRVTAAKAAAQPSCASIGAVTRAQTLAKTSATASRPPNSTTAVRPARHSVPVTAGTAADQTTAEASTVAAKRGPKPAAQARSHQLASSRSDRRTSNRRQPAAAEITGAKAAATGGKSGKQAGSSKDTAAASRPADASMARRTRAKPALKAEVPTRVQPSRAAKQGWR